MDGEMTAYGWIMMVVFSTLFAVLLATAIWALASYGRRTRADQERRSSPEELLAERYAGGDMTTEEYQERLATLRE